MAHNEEKKQRLEAKLEPTRMLELADGTLDKLL